MRTFFVYLFRHIFVLCGVLYIGTTHDCLCPFCRVLLILEFLAPVLVFDDESLVDYFATSWMSWFWFSLEGIVIFLLLGIFSMSISSMRSFNSTTLGDGYGVSYVINSGCEIGVKLICCSLFVVFNDSFIVAFISFLMLTAIYLIHPFM